MTENILHTAHNLSSHGLRNALLFMVAVRIAFSFLHSDGIMRSDSVTYTGAVVNVLEHRSLSAVLPADEEFVRRGMSFSELRNYLRSHPSSEERLLPYQWLHVLVYAPFLAVFPSLLTVIVINILLLAGAASIFFNRLSPTHQLLSWAIALFYPHLIILSESFLTEPLFFLLLSLVWWCVVQPKERPTILFLAGTALMLCRPLGLALSCLAALFLLTERRYRSAVALVVALAAAGVINSSLMHTSTPSATVHHTPGVAEAFYLSNTPLSNGDIDAYYIEPERQLTDSTYTHFSAGRINGFELVLRTCRQIIEKPLSYLALTFDKSLNLMFSIVPKSWLYPPLSPQSFVKKAAHIVLNGLLWLLLVHGYLKSESSRTKSICALWAAAIFLLHIFLAARYRYIAPLVFLGIPFVAVGILQVASRFERIFLSRKNR